MNKSMAQDNQNNNRISKTITIVPLDSEERANVLVIDDSNVQKSNCTNQIRFSAIKNQFHLVTWNFR